MKKLDLKVFDVVELTNDNRAIIKKIKQDGYFIQEFENNNEKSNFRMIDEKKIKKVIHTKD